MTMTKKTVKEMIAVMQAFEDGKPIESAYRAAEHEAWRLLHCPNWDWFDYDYRVAVIKPSIDWSHVSDQFNAIVTGPNGQSWLTETIPVICKLSWISGGSYRYAETFASFIPGTCDWQDSLVVRPGYKELAGLTCSKKMLRAAQSSYEGNPEYGLTDEDMKRAILAALKEVSQ